MNRFVETIIRGAVEALDLLVAGMFTVCDRIIGVLSWLDRKLWGYCEPECKPLRLVRVDGMGDHPDEIILRCRKCGRLIHRREALYDGP